MDYEYELTDGYSVTSDTPIEGYTNEELLDGEENYGETEVIEPPIEYDEYHFDYEDAFLVVLFGIILIIWFFALVFSIAAIVGLWKVFKKAGRGGWEAIIPVYNNWVLFEITGYPGWISLLALVPWIGAVVILVFNILAKIRLARAFGKSDGFAVGLIFLEPVFYNILGFDKSKYTKIKNA